MVELLSNLELKKLNGPINVNQSTAIPTELRISSLDKDES